MAILLVLLLIVIALMCYLLFAPFYLEINTISQLYRFRFHRLASARFIMKGQSPWLEVKIAGIKKEFELLKQGKKKKASRKKTKAKKMKFQTGRISAIIRSFKINECDVAFDTGDMQLNGMLFPLGYFIQLHSGKNIRINFIGENYLIIEIENNLARIARAYIKK